MTLSSDNRTDQSGFELALEATADLVAAGVPLGDISARAASQGVGFATLAAAVERLVAETSPTTAPVLRALLLWAQSVEKRIGEFRDERDQLLGLLAAREELPSPRRKPDSTTAALERAGEAMAARQGQTAALQPGQTQPVAVNPAPAVGETCARCGKPLTVNGRMRSCEPCSTSWMVPKKRAPLAQSAWVPGPGEDSLASAQDAALKAALATVEARDTENRQQAERIRELEAEVERLKANNATLAPAERSAHAAAVVMRLRKLVTAASNRAEVSSHAVATKADELLQELRDCESGGWLRIEFSVKEVLQ